MTAGSSASLSPAQGQPLPGLIGLYGGSFDPVHLGHLETADELLARLPFAEIRLLPNARSPLKTATPSPRHRIAMLELALAGKPGLTLDTRELRRPPPSYTVDTLRELRAELGEAQPLVFIMGLDSFLHLPAWKDWQVLTTLAHLLVVNRPGFTEDFSPELAAWLKNVRTDEARLLQSRPSGLVHFFDTQPWQIASRDLREAISQDADVSAFLAPAVWDYIQSHHLYRLHGDIQTQ